MISLLASAWIVCGATAVRSAPSQLRLFDLTTAHGIVDDKPLHPAQVFAPDDDAVYLWYGADGCAVGTTIRSSWFYLETDPPLLFSGGAVTVDHPDNWGQFNFRLAAGRRWPLGRYRIALTIDDQLIAEAYFQVAPEPSAGIQAAPIPKP